VRGNGGQVPSFASLCESCAAVLPYLTVGTGNFRAMKRMIKRVALLLAFSSLIGGACLFYAQPLLASRAYVVTATLDGKPIQAELLRPPAIPGTFYIRLPEAPPEHGSWFGIAFSRKSVFSPVALDAGWRGFPYIHTDQAKGVSLTDPKMEDDWVVSFPASGVRFSNGSLEVSLTKPE
jgi:hypothetical protein